MQPQKVILVLPRILSLFLTKYGLALTQKCFFTAANTDPNCILCDIQDISTEMVSRKTQSSVYQAYLHTAKSSIFIFRYNAETHCRIAHNLGILLMNSK